MYPLNQNIQSFIQQIAYQNFLDTQLDIQYNQRYSFQSQNDDNCVTEQMISFRGITDSAKIQAMQKGDYSTFIRLVNFYDESNAEFVRLLRLFDAFRRQTSCCSFGDFLLWYDGTEDGTAKETLWPDVPEAAALDCALPQSAKRPKEQDAQLEMALEIYDDVYLTEYVRLVQACRGKRPDGVCQVLRALQAQNPQVFNRLAQVDAQFGYQLYRHYKEYMAQTARQEELLRQQGAGRLRPQFGHALNINFFNSGQHMLDSQADGPYYETHPSSPARKLPAGWCDRFLEWQRGNVSAAEIRRVYYYGDDSGSHCVPEQHYDSAMVDGYIADLVMHLIPHLFSTCYAEQLDRSFMVKNREQKLTKLAKQEHIDKNSQHLATQKRDIEKVTLDNQNISKQQVQIETVLEEINSEIQREAEKNESALESVDSKISEVKGQLNSVLIQTSEKKDQKQQLENQLQVIKAYIQDDLSKNQQQTIAQIKHNQEELARQRTEQQDISAKFQDIDQQKHEFRIKQDEFSNKVSKYQEKMKQVEEEIISFNQTQYQSVFEKIKQFNEGFVTLKNILTNIKSCQRDIDNTQNKISKLENDIEGLKVENAELIRNKGERGPSER